MPRTTFANDGLLDYLSLLSNPKGYTIGLILGQSCAQKDFVIHLARTSQPSKKDVIEESVISGGCTLNQIDQDSVDKTCIKSIKDIPASWVADHAKHVTRMLPGGMRVLGIFIVGPEDVFNSNACVEKIKAILASIDKNLTCNPYLYGNLEQEQLVLNVNSISKKYVCKSLDTRNGNNGGILKPVDWKFQTDDTFTKWHHLETLVDFDRLFPIARCQTPVSLKKQLQDILKETSNMINSSLVIIEGELRCLDDAIETIGKQQQQQEQQQQQQLTKEKKKKNCSDKENTNDVAESSKKILQVGLYMPCEKSFDMQANSIACSASMRLVGQLVSRTFVHQKATIQEAVNAVKQDVLRSLASRLEMHWDSLIEEEDGCPEETVTLHEPPRRVLVQLFRNKVILSDYLFPGEGTQEALLSLGELLDIKHVQESNIQQDLELQVDPSEFYCRNAETTSAASDVSNHQKNVIGKRSILIFITGFSFAILILIIAIIFNRI